MPIPEMPAPVAAAFDAYPGALRRRLCAVRTLIFDEAAAAPEIGPLTETLKWGEPAYLTEATRAGSTIRLGARTKGSGAGALFLNCQTTLVEELRGLCAGDLEFDGNRAVLIPPDGPLPAPALRLAIRMALTYHLRKRRGQVGSGASALS